MPITDDTRSSRSAPSSRLISRRCERLRTTSEPPGLRPPRQSPTPRARLDARGVPRGVPADEGGTDRRRRREHGAGGAHPAPRSGRRAARRVHARVAGAPRPRRALPRSALAVVRGPAPRSRRPVAPDPQRRPRPVRRGDHIQPQGVVALRQLRPRVGDLGGSTGDGGRVPGMRQAGRGSDDVCACARTIARRAAAGSGRRVASDPQQ
jgi:hypothetical protein